MEDVLWNGEKRVIFIYGALRVSSFVGVVMGYSEGLNNGLGLTGERVGRVCAYTYEAWNYQ